MNLTTGSATFNEDLQVSAAFLMDPKTKRYYEKRNSFTVIISTSKGNKVAGLCEVDLGAYANQGVQEKTEALNLVKSPDPNAKLHVTIKTTLIGEIENMTKMDSIAEQDSDEEAGSTEASQLNTDTTRIDPGNAKFPQPNMDNILANLSTGTNLQDVVASRGPLTQSIVATKNASEETKQNQSKQQDFASPTKPSTNPTDKKLMKANSMANSVVVQDLTREDLETKRSPKNKDLSKQAVNANAEPAVKQNVTPKVKTGELEGDQNSPGPSQGAAKGPSGSGQSSSSNVGSPAQSNGPAASTNPNAGNIKGPGGPANQTGQSGQGGQNSQNGSAGSGMSRSQGPNLNPVGQKRSPSQDKRLNKGEEINGDMSKSTSSTAVKGDPQNKDREREREPQGTREDQVAKENFLKMKALIDQLRHENEELRRSGAIQITDSNAKAAFLAMKEENERLKKEIITAKQGSQAQQDIEKEVGRLSTENETLKKQVKDLTSKMSSGKGASDNQQAKENEELKKKTNDLQRSLKKTEDDLIEFKSKFANLAQHRENDDDIILTLNQKVEKLQEAVGVMEMELLKAKQKMGEIMNVIIEEADSDLVDKVNAVLYDHH